MNLPALDSFKRFGSPTARGGPAILGLASEGSGKANADAFSSSPLSFYKLNRQAEIPPGSPTGYVPARIVTAFNDLSKNSEQLSRRDRSPGTACLPKWACSTRQPAAEPSREFRSEWKSRFIPFQHDSSPFESQNDPLISRTQEIPLELERRLLVRGLKLYMDRDVEKAKMLARWAVGRYPESRDLQKLLKLLNPSRVVTHIASGVSRKDDFQWLKANQRLYSGQWVAIFKGRCLASGKDLHSVRETARKLANLQDVLITFLPKEKRRAPLPKEG